LRVSGFPLPDKIIQLGTDGSSSTFYSGSLLPAPGSCIFIFPSGGRSMSITVRIPSVLRQYTELKSEIIVEGKNVREVMDNFKIRFPDAGARFFSSKTARYMNFYLNDQDIRSLADLDTLVKDNDVLSIIFAIAGG
jgi:sulfur-carrier protein